MDLSVLKLFISYGFTKPKGETQEEVMCKPRDGLQLARERRTVAGCSAGTRQSFLKRVG
jgi:hypothetical protein